MLEYMCACVHGASIFIKMNALTLADLILHTYMVHVPISDFNVNMFIMLVMPDGVHLYVKTSAAALFSVHFI